MPTPPPPPGPIVAAVGVFAASRAALGAAIAAQGLAVRWCDSGTGASSDTEPLVCVGAALGSPCDAHVEQAVRRGARVLVLAAGSDGWSIGERSRLAVLGAAALHDSLQPGCAEQAAAQLRNWWHELEQQALADQTDERLRATLGIVGRGAALQRAWSLLRRAATLSDLPVLLLGDTGTGKELMARAVHRLDRRRSTGPWLALNCAAIAPALAEAELFGAQRGAYTGSQRDRPGLIAAADGGVLFLDEVGELADDLQAKLLRVIQERSVRAVGATHERPVDVRIVAATHRDLAARVHDGSFREDLYYRLAVLPVELPPLSARREDIPPLVAHLLARATAAGAPPMRATPALLGALAQCELPGNVRQLDNLLCQARVAAGGAAELDLAHLPLSLLRTLQATEATPAPPADMPAGVPARLHELFAAGNWKLNDCAALCERELLAAALQRSRGNQAAMARMLGVTPRCIYTKLRKHLLA